MGSWSRDHFSVIELGYFLISYTKG